MNQSQQKRKQRQRNDPMEEFDYLPIFTESWYKAEVKIPCSVHGLEGDPNCSECWTAMKRTIEIEKDRKK